MKEIAVICLNLDQVRITVNSLLMDTSIKLTPWLNEPRELATTFTYSFFTLCKTNTTLYLYVHSYSLSVLPSLKK